ncbi:MAG: adenosylmethionine--8-amino-7-oxononanoate transaminase [Verrucomicrobiota bacterium]|nr:adenosylmethionine--8-amino-7-oxononanoate transaminase [Verrucomicrobiota bacterium]
MAEWCAPEHEPLVLVEGKGARLWDSEGREYIDGNSSIWTNIHGHNHPHINAAITQQLERVAHTSFLGFANPAAIELAEAVVGLFPPNTVTRVFFSDDGSTGMEAALRMTEQFWRLQGADRPNFMAFHNGYHGDTAGAASLGAGSLFGGRPAAWQFPASSVASMAELQSLPTAEARRIAAVVIEPMVQGAAGMKLWPKGTLKALRQWCDSHDALLIADEVLTGFGRTGTMMASERDGVTADITVLGKALSGGYLPLAITAVSDKVFSPFARSSAPENTFFYGHSYTGNALGCAAAKASLEIFAAENVLERLQPKIALMRHELAGLSALGSVAEVRQCGFIAGIQLHSHGGKVGHAGAEVCRIARQHGLLTRPIRDVVVLMPPYCITEHELKAAVAALRISIQELSASPAEAARL